MDKYQCQGALEVLWEEYYDEDFKVQDPFSFRTALEIVTKCVKKQISEKPKWGHHCPNCEIGLAIPEMLMEEYKELCRGCCYPKYCPDCGQRLDWE